MADQVNPLAEKIAEALQKEGFHYDDDAWFLPGVKANERTHMLAVISPILQVEGDGWIPCSTLTQSTHWCHIVINGVVQLMPAAFDAADKKWIWLDGSDSAPAEVASHYQPLPSAPVSGPAAKEGK